MRTPSFLVLTTALVLASCTAPAAGTPKTLTFEESLRNPLFAERYWTELTDRMVTLQLNDDPVLKDDTKAAAADRVRLNALDRAEESTALKAKGMHGFFLRETGELTDGDVLLMHDALHFGTTFATYPGVDLRVYLTEVIDPRDGAFPDATAIDIGKLQSPYGAQTYALTTDLETLRKQRSVVLWDARLGRLYSFAQITGAIEAPAK